MLGQPGPLGMGGLVPLGGVVGRVTWVLMGEGSAFLQAFRFLSLLDKKLRLRPLEIVHPPLLLGLATLGPSTHFLEVSRQSLLLL